jgi:hypothetical protein
MQSTLVAQSPALPPPEIIRQRAEEILSRPEYQLESASWDFTPILQWFLDILRKILSPIASAINGIFEISPWLGWLTIGALLTITALVMAHIIYSIAKAMKEKKKLEPALASGYEPDHGPETWERRAQEAFANQEYLAAVRYLFRACLLRLELANKRRIRRGATNREYLRRYRDTAAFEPLSRFVEVIDTKWYGGGSCALDDYQDCAQAHSTICRFAEKVMSAHGS